MGVLKTFDRPMVAEIEKIEGLQTEELETSGLSARELATTAGQGQPTAGQVRFAAMNLLAAREHSALELEQKLSRRFGVNELIQTVIGQLQDEALQSDQRFTEAFINMRKRKGQGPVRIAKDLALRGISGQLTRTGLAAHTDWHLRAKEVCQKKYHTPSDDPATKARQMRFLQYRGFDLDQIQFVWSPED